MFILRKHHIFNICFSCYLIGGISILSFSALAQPTVTNEPPPLEEITVVGTQIKDSAISDALSISVVGADDIERLGVDSGEDLLNLIPENGQNFFNEGENLAGGVNAARGDVGAFNLRSLGTGNTLVLLNGRRMVNAATYQTEDIGGSFVPVNTVNSNSIPVAALKRLEVLRDGASAIYGADAVAGVINNVMQTNYEGFSIRGKWQEFDHISRNDQTLTLKLGKDFNQSSTNISSFVNYYMRDRVSAQEESRWANSDFRYRVPTDSPWFESTSFRNASANSSYGQYDLVVGAAGVGLRDVLTDRSGEFETFPNGDERCQYEIGYGTCGGIDGQGNHRYNSNLHRDLASELSRLNVFVSITHEFESGINSFTEFSWYQASTNQRRSPSNSLTGARLRVGAENYWNPLGPCSSVNRLPNDIIGDDVPCSGLELSIDNYRFVGYPRVIDNDSKTWRLLQGVRGSLGDWDWESAIVVSKAAKNEVTHNRVSNTLMQNALFDSTKSAYNPFSGGVNSNIEQALIDVKRDNKTGLNMVDFKFSNNELLSVPAGFIGFVSGLEYRQESFVDDRDDRLDGTIKFTDWDGDTYPFVSNVVGSSPTPDNSGKRNVASIFTEIQVPVFSNFDTQMAIRHENFSDTKSATVGKLAFGWHILEQVMLRASWSQSFRAPNLVTVNEDVVVRSSPGTDKVCEYAAIEGGDPDQDELDCSYSIQRKAQGSELLVPEESDNTSLGLVLNLVDGLTITLDYWSIEKENTIGLIGDENHSLLDLKARIEAGTSDCAAFTGNLALKREAVDPELEPYYLAAGICPAGLLAYVDDQYANLDDRIVRGHDLGVYYDISTRLGDFSLSYNGAFLDQFEQKAGGELAELIEAQEKGTIPASLSVDGFSDLIGMSGNQRERQSIRFYWQKNAWGVSLSGYKVGSFYQQSLTLDDGTLYIIPSMTTWDTTVSYDFDLFGGSNRVRLGIKNITDERAPLADRYYGFLSDAHQDYGVSYYLDASMRF